MRPTLHIATFLSAAVLALAACSSPEETPPPGVTPAPTITSPPTSTAFADVGPAVTQPPASTQVATITPLPTATTASPLTPESTEETPDFRPGPEDIITLLPYDAIKAILEPRLVDVEWANQQMTDLEQVIGVSIGGEHRAYPIYMLSSREIVNDVVGGVPIAVTW